MRARWASVVWSFKRELPLKYGVRSIEGLEFQSGHWPVTHVCPRGAHLASTSRLGLCARLEGSEAGAAASAGTARPLHVDAQLVLEGGRLRGEHVQSKCRYYELHGSDATDLLTY